jgi:hypothetical protein
MAFRVAKPYRSDSMNRSRISSIVFLGGFFLGGGLRALTGFLLGAIVPPAPGGVTGFLRRGMGAGLGLGLGLGLGSSRLGPGLSLGLSGGLGPDLRLGAAVPPAPGGVCLLLGTAVPPAPARLFLRRSLGVWVGIVISSCA